LSGGSLGVLEAATQSLYPETILKDSVLLFQIWSEDWNTWVDLMEGDCIPDKSKIQVIVKHNEQQIMPKLWVGPL
jgi:hypothetical protein